MKGIIVVQNRTDINSNKTDNNIFIYPNPTNSIIHFNLNISEPQKALLNIFNMAGQKFMEYQVQNGENSIDLRSLSDGVYYLIITSNKKKIYSSRVTLIK